MGGEVVSATAFVVSNRRLTSGISEYIDLVEGENGAAKRDLFMRRKENPIRVAAIDLRRYPVRLLARLVPTY